jgi:hypothetical protein
MYLRMAPEAVSRRLTLWLLGGCWLSLVSCSPGAARVTVAWTIDPTPPVVSTDTLVRLRLSQADAPVRGAKLRLEAHMTHPGMQPVEAGVDEEGDGRYRSRLRLTMAGDWLFVVTGTLPDGRRIVNETRVPDVRAASAAAPRG